MNCYLDLAFSTKLVEKYKQALPTFRTPGTNTFKGDLVFNAMMAINLDEHRIEYVEKNPEQKKVSERLCGAVEDHREKRSESSRSLLGQ